MAAPEQPKDLNGWYVYEHTAEGLFWKTLAPRIDPTLRAKLKALSIDLDGKPKSVPHAHWKEALKLSAESLFTGPLDERYRQLGQSVLKNYDQTLMGKAVVSVMRIMGPKRVLARIEQTLRSGNNYITAALKQVEPTLYECHVNECNGNPWYIAGVLEQGLIISGAKEVKVEVFDFDGHAARFQMRWAG